MSVVAEIGAVAERRPNPLTRIFDEIRVITARNLAHIPRTPERLADVTVMPILFVVLFGYVFGSAIALPGVETDSAAAGAYREFLVAGIFVYSMVFMSITTAVGVANDMKEGVIDRFRSLPISRVSVLGGRIVATLAEGMFGITVMAICGLLIGWGAHNGFFETVAAFALLAGIALAAISIGTFIGQLVKNPMTAQTIGVSLVFPLTFASNAFVPTDNMPGFLKAFAEWNPISAMVAATRDLFGNGYVVPIDAPWPLQNPILASVIWIVVLAGLGISLAAWKYARGQDR